MKRIIMFVLLFAALKVAGQTTGYLRFDTVRIMKQNGSCELYVINKTKDSLGLLTNVGGGLTRFIKPKMLNDSVLIVGLDTLTIHGAGGATQRFGLEDNSASANRTFNANGYNFNTDSVGNYNVYSKAKTSGSDRGIITNFGFNTNNTINLWSYIPGSSTRSYGFNAYGALTQMFAAGHVAGNTGYVQADTTQIILESDPNRLYLRHDSVTITNFNNSPLDFRLRPLPQTIDTTTWKPLAIGTNGQVKIVPGWPGSGGGGGSSPAGVDREIQINNSGAFGVKTGAKVTTDGTIVSDSIRNKRYNVLGDSTFDHKIVFYPSKTKTGSVKGAIGFGEHNNEHDADSTVNNTMEMRIGSIDGVTDTYVRLGLEKRWKSNPGDFGYWMESHLEYRDVNGKIHRPSSWTGDEEGDDGTWSHRANLHSYFDWDGSKPLGGFSRGAGEFTTYHNYSGTGNITLTVRDSTNASGNEIAAGMNILGQMVGGVRTNNTTHYGRDIIVNWESGPFFRTGKASTNNIGFNYVFSINDTNTNHLFAFGKDFPTRIDFWGHQDGRIVVGDANNFFSSYKFQAKNGANSFVFGDFDASNNSILYSGAFAHRLTSGAGAAGFGAGFRFEGDNGSNTQTVISDIAGVWAAATAGAENGDILGRTRRAGTLTNAFRSYSTGEFSIETIDSTSTPANMVYQDPITKKLMKAAVPSGGGSDGNGIYSGSGTLPSNVHVSGGASGHSLQIDSSSSISLFSGLEFISSGIGSSIQMSDSVMSIGSSSATDFTSFTFSPTRIKFIAADGAGSAGNVWTNTGSGYGHWAAPAQVTFKGTTNWTPGSVSAGSSATTNVTVTGASVGDPVSVCKLAGYSNGEIVDAFVTAPNTVTIRTHNVSTGGATYSASDYNVIVHKY